jgi:hypothetical protein
LSHQFNIHQGSRPRWRLAFVAFVSILGFGCIAYAQTTPAAAPSMKQAPAQAPAFRSAFEGYQPYADDGAPEWKKANDEVGKIGGWRAYAREAQGNQKSEGQSSRPETMSTTAPQPDPHAGHAGHEKP